MTVEQFRPRGFNFLPPVVKNLLIINGLFFLATITFDSVYHIELADYLGLHFFQSPLFKPWQYITYLFMHGSMDHIFFNMLALWMFGYVLENHWGGKKFLFYYLVCGVGAALIQSIVVFISINYYKSMLSPGEVQEVYEQGLSVLNQGKNFIGAAGGLNAELNSVTVGASGAVFGILLAFGMLFPNQLVYIYFLIPIKAKWFVIFYGALELIFGVTNTQSNVAHFAHLGGMLFGFIMIQYWKKNNTHHNYYN
jgi:membrane associated rhomboid family serine protease